MSQYVLCVDEHARRSVQLMTNGPPPYTSPSPSSPDVSDVGPRAPSRGASEIEVQPMSSTSSSPDVSVVGRGHDTMPTSHVPSPGASEVAVDYPVGLGCGRTARWLGRRR